VRSDDGRTVNARERNVAVFLAAGGLIVAAGAALIYPPAGLILVGLVVIAITVLVGVG